jgi:outer membrane lipoprotein-sorting protein
MERRDLVDLLYTAHGRFKSLQLSWTYRYDEEILRQLLENSSTQLLRRVASSPADIPDQQQTNVTKIIKRRIWWRRPGCWREEQRDNENEQSVTIVCDGQSWQYSTKHKVLFTNTTGAPDQSFGSYKIQRTDSTPSTEDVSEHVQLLDPSFLLASHELKVVGETVHAGRPGVVIRGKYLKHRELLFEDFFWATADEYTFIVDREYGVLLRYAYIQDSREVAVSSVDEVIFDQPIPANVFLPGPVA